MGRSLGVFVVFLMFSCGQTAWAQQLTIQSTQTQPPAKPTELTDQLTRRPVWDVGVTAGLFQSDPDSENGPYGDDWYQAGRYAVSAGRFWTPHLKTEVEFATTGEGSRFTNRYASVAGVPPYYPISIQEHFRVNQLSGRVVWQFFENAWVHPYVFGGVAADAERREVWIPEQFFTPNDPRAPGNRILVSPKVDETTTTYRAAAVAGFGTKVYMTQKSYFNAGFTVSRAKSSTAVSYVAGFGWEF
jgi:hypothetical protein